MTITAASNFSFKNVRGNIEQVQEQDEIFTFVDSNSVKGKTYVVGKILRPIFEPQPPIIEISNQGAENETTLEIPQPDKLVRKDQIGEFVTNNGEPLNINWVEPDYAIKCENAIIAELQAITANDGIVFTSSILPQV